MRRKWAMILVTILLLGALSSCKAHEETPTDRIRKDIEFFCSNECNGRLPGSHGNELAMNYIQAAFESAELISLKGYDSLLVPYEQTVFEMEQEQVLTAVFTDGSVKTFWAGKDFYPCLDLDMKDGGFSGEVTTDPLDPDLSNKVYLAQNGESVVDALAVVAESDRGSAILITGNPATLFTCNSSVFEQLTECESLFLEGITATKNEMLNNVIGVLPSSAENAKDALLITAHFDHVGGYGDTIYRGALDNASGVALLLEVMRQLTSEGNVAEYDIVFAAFNGEDMGRLGSRALAEKLPYQTVNVINFDCVGYKNEPTLGVVGENKELQAAVISVFNDNLSCVPYDDAPNSDHNSFEEQGVPAVTVSNYFGEIDVGEIIHQAADIPDILDFNAISAMVEPICKYSLEGGLIQPEMQDSNLNNGVTAEELGEYEDFLERARNAITQAGMSYNQVLPMERLRTGDFQLVVFVRDISFLANTAEAEAVIFPDKFPENLGRFQLDRSAPLYEASDGYYLKIRLAEPDENYEIGVPQEITGSRDSIQSWKLNYSDGNIYLTLAALDQQLTDLESILLDEEYDEMQLENGTIYQCFHTWESKKYYMLSIMLWTSFRTTTYYITAMIIQPQSTMRQFYK